jgi:uncharacterized NAD-dependent epimerase/dehydratase family protein
MRCLSAGSKVALLMHGYLGHSQGKHGIGMLRYSSADIVAVVDRYAGGRTIREVVQIDRDVPVVATVDEARAMGADILLVAIAPPGGQLPDGWNVELHHALELGMSLVNPLHQSWNADPEMASRLAPGAWIWDVRQEPADLQPATGAARLLSNVRLLTVGTDMAVGKMTASLELVRSLRSRGIRADMVATGQVGITIVGTGVPLDAVRLDYAPGAVEREVLRASESCDVVVVEGQGALCHPGASANLALLRGTMPTHLLLVHRASQTTERQHEWAKIPDLVELIKLHEDLAECCGTFVRPTTIGIALNTAHLTDSEASEEIARVQDATGLPVADPVRQGAELFADVLATSIAQPSPR